MNTAPLHYSTKRGFWLVRGFGSIAMAAASVMMVRSAEGGPVKWVGIAGVIFFGIGAVVGIVQGMRRGPRLTLDAEGINDRSLGVGVIAWSDITRAEPYGVAGKPFVGLTLRDPAKYLARAGGVKRRLARLNAGSGMPAFSVNLVGLDADPTYVARLIMSRCQPDGAPPTR